MKNVITITAILVLFLMTGLSFAAQETQDKLSRQDRNFAKEAAMDGMTEVNIGEQATKKAQNEEVKDLGKRLAANHKKANDQLMQIAQKQGVQLPQSIDSKAQKQLESLNKKTGAEYDRAFLNYVVSDHKKSIGLFEKQVKQGQDPAFKDFASKTLPVLREHLKTAQNLEQKMGKKSSSMTPKANIMKTSSGATGNKGESTTKTGR